MKAIKPSMRPSATESLYKELEIQEGAYEYSLPANYAIRPLRLSDVEQSIELEQKGFPEHERVNPERLKYHLEVCPELCAGVFVREFQWPVKPEDKKAANGVNLNSIASMSTEVEDEEEEEPTHGVVAKRSTLVKEKLVGHIIASKTEGKHVSDRSMEIGAHSESGRTIAIHSVVVDPEYQGKHIGYVMFKDYVQKFFGLCSADGMALLAHEKLVPFYTKHGFKDEGKSSSAFAGESWRALRLPFDTFDDQIEE